MTRTTILQIFFTLVMYVLGILILSASLFPSLYLISVFWRESLDMSFGLRILGLSFWIVLGYFIFGLTLLFTASLSRILLGLRVKEGVYKVGSLMMLKWMMSSALVITVRFVFMDFILLTPFAALFYRMMGAKLGTNVQINSLRVGDIPMLEIGDHSVIGGNATVICHLFEKKGLILKKVVIGKNVIIGLNSVIMPGAEIRDNSVVAPGVIVPKNTVVEKGTVYYGPQKKA